MTVKELQELCKPQNKDDEVFFEYGHPGDGTYARWFPKAEDFKFKTNYGGKDG